MGTTGKVTVRRAGAHPSFHNVIRHVPHSGPRYVFTGYMDDFGFLVPVDFSKLAIIFRS